MFFGLKDLTGDRCRWAAWRYPNLLQTLSIDLHAYVDVIRSSSDTRGWNRCIMPTLQDSSNKRNMDTTSIGYPLVELNCTALNCFQWCSCFRYDTLYIGRMMIHPDDSTQILARTEQPHTRDLSPNFPIHISTSALRRSQSCMFTSRKTSVRIVSQRLLIQTDVLHQGCISRYRHENIQVL